VQAKNRCITSIPIQQQLKALGWIAFQQRLKERTVLQHLESTMVGAQITLCHHLQYNPTIN
jgi:hypothetical protein